MYKGQLEDFPTEIVEKMLENQRKQGNKKDVNVFELSSARGKTNGGFNWDSTAEGISFWGGILNNKNFNLFFDKYPKQIELPKVFCISCNVKNPLWEKYIAWLNKTYKREMSGLVSAYYGVTEKFSADYYFNPAAFGYNTQIITLEQWYDLFIKPTIQINKMENSYKFTIDYVKNNKVGILVKTQNEIDELKKLNCYGHLVSLDRYKNGFYTIPKSGSWFENSSFGVFDYETITAKEFIQYNSTNKMEKEIIGYIVPYDINTYIKKDDLFTQHTSKQYCKKENRGRGSEYYLYEELVKTWQPAYKIEFKVGDWLICDDTPVPKANKVTEINDNYYKTNSSIADPSNVGYAKDLKGLRLATKEEIDKVNQVTYTMGKSGTGTFQLVVRDGRVFHKSEDITKYVKDIQSIYTSTITNHKIASYDFIVKDVVISKTGCENVETLLSQWLVIKL